MKTELEKTTIEIKLACNLTGITRANIMLNSGWRVVRLEQLSSVTHMNVHLEKQIPKPVATKSNKLAVIGFAEPDYRRANNLPPIRVDASEAEYGEAD